MSETEKGLKRLHRGTIALGEQGATLMTVAAAMVADEPLAEPTAPPAPPQVAMTDELVHALGILPAVFGSIQPDEVRQLTARESALLHEERAAIKTVLDVLGTREGAIKEAVRNHMALQAQASGRVTPDTELDGSGRPIVARPKDPQRSDIEGTTQAWSLEYRAGKVEINGDKLLKMYEAGEITREEYLEFTREVRVFDEDKAFKAIAKDPGKLGLLNKIVKRGRASTSLFVRKQTKK